MLLPRKKKCGWKKTKPLKIILPKSLWTIIFSNKPLNPMVSDILTISNLFYQKNQIFFSQQFQKERYICTSVWLNSWQCFLLYWHSYFFVRAWFYIPIYIISYEIWSGMRIYTEYKIDLHPIIFNKLFHHFHLERKFFQTPTF